MDITPHETLGLETFEIPLYPTSDIIFLGKKRQGKGVGTESFIHYLYETQDLRPKFIDIYNTKRQEHDYRGLKPKEKENNQHVLPIETWHPFVRSMLPNELPDFYKLFTLPLTGPNKLTSEEFAFLFRGKLKQNYTDLVNMARTQLKANQHLGDLMELVSNIINEPEKYAFYNNRVNIKLPKRMGAQSIYEAIWKLMMEGLVTSGKCPLNLDFERVLNDTKTITGFSFTSTDQHYRYVILSYLIRKILDLKPKIRHPVVVVIKEAGEILGAKTRNPAHWHFKEDFIDFQSNAGDLQIRIILDTQNLYKLEKNIYDLSENFVCFKNTAERDREILTNILGCEVPDLRYLDIGQALVFSLLYPSGMYHKVKCRMPPHRHKEEGVIFNDEWKKEGGKMLDMNSYYKSVEKEYGEDWKAESQQSS